MITVSDVSLSFGGQMLFKDVNLLFTATAMVLSAQTAQESPHS